MKTNTKYINEIDFSTIEIIKKIDQAKYWEFHSGALFICNGHHINVYMIDPDQSGWSETGFFNVGSFKNDQAKIEDYKNGIKDYIDRLEEDMIG